MPAILRSKVKRLMGDIEDVEKDMHVLLQNYEAWIKEPKKSNLGEIIGDIKRLEWTMNLIFLDCISSGRKYWKGHNVTAIESLHQAFAFMEGVFDDIKRIKENSTAGFMNPSELRELLADWVYFKGSVFHIHKILQKSPKRRKRYPSPGLNGNREQE